jgi:hypothetical protein
LTTNIATYTGLKGWLRFQPLTWTFVGIPPVTAAGTYSITIKVNDPFLGYVNDPFTLKINTKPAIPTSGLYTAGIDKVFMIPQGTKTINLANYFYDPDTAQGDVLTYSII